MDDTEIEPRPVRIPEDDLWMHKYTFRGRWERRIQRMRRMFRKKQAIAIGMTSGLLCGACSMFLVMSSWLSS
jgi:hypothetical protein